MISRETIDRIYAAAKIEEVVGDYVRLRRRGANLVGLCPFHTEKTGSFTVSPSKGIYKCFGCGASGNAVGFVMEVEQCSYVEALKQVGRKYHIEVEERQLTAEEQQRQDDRESMFVVNDYCTKWFQEQLWNSTEGQAIGLSYFRERGLRDDIVRKFQLGYSPERGNPLATALKQQGFVEKYIVNDPETKIGTGICGKSEDGRLYDRFRDRVIFPIHTVSGKTVAFAGRILKKKENVGKYVNSPDSIIYSKTDQLYGLFLAKQAIARHDLCYLVEGQMDVISMHQAGIENVVASGGTALTKPQIRLIKRFTNNITVLYDGDAAGIHAAVRGIDMFLEEGFSVRVVLLPDGEDPDSFAQSHNASDFIDYIEMHQTDFIRFKITLLRDEAGNDPQKRAALIKDITQSIAQIPDLITRQVYIKDSADRLQVQEQLLTREVVRLRREKTDEAKRAREEAERMAAFAGVAAETGSSPAEAAATAQLRPLSRLEENYRNLLQAVVRYGERILYTQEDGSAITVGEYVFGQLAADGIAPPTPVYRRMAETYCAHCHEEGFVAARFFTFYPDTEISRCAINLIADRYPLSQLYVGSGTMFAPGGPTWDEKAPKEHPEAAQEDIEEMIPRMLYEIKLTVIEERIDEIDTQLGNIPSEQIERMRPLMETRKQLILFRNEICKLLGNRVIVR